MSRAARWLIATAVASSPLHAAEYTAAGRIGINGEHDDNVALVERGENAISGVSLAPALRLGYRTPDLTVSLDTQLNFARFDERDYDSSDQRMILDVAKQTPRNELGLQAGGVRDSTRTSELEDTGRVSRRAVRREDYWLAPSWLTYLSERNALRFGASFHDVSYGSRTYTDYTTAGVDVTWLHILSPRTTLKLQGYLNRFDVGDALDTLSDTAGMMAGADFALTENLKLSALAGAAKVETRRDLPPSVPFSRRSNENVTVVDARLDYTQPRWSLSFNVASQTYPSADGLIQQRRFARAAWSYRLSELLTLRLGALYGQNESVERRFRIDRDYADADAGIDWRITQSLYLNARYRYRFQDYDNAPGDASGNAVFFGIRYEPVPKRWSR